MEELGREGWCSVVFNFRGCGLSGGDIDMRGWHDDLATVAGKVHDLPGIDPGDIHCLRGKEHQRRPLHRERLQSAVDEIDPGCADRQPARRGAVGTWLATRDGEVEDRIAGSAYVGHRRRSAWRCGGNRPGADSRGQALRPDRALWACTATTTAARRGATGVRLVQERLALGDGGDAAILDHDSRVGVHAVRQDDVAARHHRIRRSSARVSARRARGWLLATHHACSLLSIRSSCFCTIPRMSKNMR